MKEYRWEEFGDMSPDELVQIFINAKDEMVEGCMIGSVVAFYTSEVPYGFLQCDGSQYQQVDYARLVDVLPDSALVGSGLFVVPDLRGRFPMGSDETAGIKVGSSGGEAEHTLTVAEIPAHTHEVAGATASATTTVIPDAPDAVATPVTSGKTGGGKPHNNIPPFFALHYGIAWR